MKKIKFALILLLLSLAQGVVHAAEVNWRFFGGLPTTHPYTKIIIKHLQEIKQKSDGKMSIRYTYYGETPYKQMDALKLVNDGLADMTEWLPANSGGTYPLLIAPELPMLSGTLGTAANLRDATSRAWDTPSMKNVLDQVTKAHHATVLARYYYEPMNIWFTKPVATLDDIKNQKVRVLTPEHAQFISSIGASPISIAQPEVYTSLQRKVLNGVITGAGNVKGSKFDEVLQSGFVMNMAGLSVRVLVSDKKLNALPEALRQIVVAEMASLQESLDAFMPESDEKGQQVLADSGLKIARITASDYEKARKLAVSDVWTSWVKRAGPQAPGVLSDVEKAFSGK